MELAYRCGATRLVAHADAELHAAGARPRNVVRTGADALTASELRVAQLVAPGRSDPQVAQELFVGLKTVEAPPRGASAKRGLSGGGAGDRLAAALEGETAGAA